MSYRGGTAPRPIRAPDGNDAAQQDAKPHWAAQKPKRNHRHQAKPTIASSDPDEGEGDGSEEDYDPDDPFLDLKRAIERKGNYFGLIRRLDYITKSGRLVGSRGG